jgi:hypothetical protein
MTATIRFVVPHAQRSGSTSQVGSQEGAQPQYEVFGFFIQA